MKTLVMTLAMTVACFANAQGLNVETQAMLIQNLNQGQVNQEVIVGGPMATISSLAILGFSVSKISFTKNLASGISENFCSINVKMNRGGEEKAYYFTLVTEKGFSQSMAGREGKKYSDYSADYRNAVSICLEMTK